MWFFKYAKNGFSTRIITRKFEAHVYGHVSYIELITNKRKNPVTLTFFLGRLTSSFIEAHLFNVFSRLHKKERKKINV